MRRAPIVIVLACFASQGVRAQEMRLLSGQLTVEPGTTMRVADGTNWLITSGATVVNHGLIDLGASASISEPDGGPITGIGVERIAPLAGAPQPAQGHGGLGLRVDQSAPLPSLVITRGHEPRTDQALGSSIARWFLIEGVTALDPDAEATLIYDDSELVSVNEIPLGLARSASLDGPWVAMPSAGDADLNHVQGPLSITGDYLTAFSFDPLSAPSRAAAHSGLGIRPSLTDGPVTILLEDGKPSPRLRIMDAGGRLVSELIISPAAHSIAADFSALPPGVYQLVAEDGRSARFVKR